MLRHKKSLLRRNAWYRQQLLQSMPAIGSAGIEPANKHHPHCHHCHLPELRTAAIDAKTIGE